MKAIRRKTVRVYFVLAIGLIMPQLPFTAKSSAIEITGPIELTVQSQLGPTHPLNIDLLATGDIFLDSQVFQRNGMGIFFPSPVSLKAESLVVTTDISNSPLPPNLPPSGGGNITLSNGSVVTLSSSPSVDISLAPSIPMANGTITIGGGPSFPPQLHPNNPGGGLTIPSGFQLVAGGILAINFLGIPTLPWPHTEFALSILSDTEPIKIKGDVLLRLKAPFLDLPQLTGRIEAQGDMHLGDYSQTAVVPEPATFLLFGSGVLGLAAWRFSTRKRQKD